MVLDDSNWSHKAWMSETDADLLESILLQKAERAEELHVLEWGSGRSTLYFGDLLKSCGAKFKWLSIEYDRGYFDEELKPKLAGDELIVYSEDAPDGIAASDLPNGVTYVVFNYGKLSPFLEEHKADRQVEMDDYVEFPKTFGEFFDLAIVDGRKRRRCILAAQSLLRPGGIVLLHDAYRTYYHCAFEAYPASKSVGDILWVGSNTSDFAGLE